MVGRQRILVAIAKARLTRKGGVVAFAVDTAPQGDGHAGCGAGRIFMMGVDVHDGVAV